MEKMNTFSQQQPEKGRDRFQADHPVIKTRIEELSIGYTAALGITFEDLKKNETMPELLAIAQQKRTDTTEFFWGYLADTPEELATMLEQREQSMRQIIG